MSKIKDVYLFKIIALTLVITFITLDISWAYPPEPGSANNSTLAAPSLLQEQPVNEHAARLKESVFSQGAILASVCDIGECFFGDQKKGVAPILSKEAVEAAGLDYKETLEGVNAKILNIVSVQDINNTPSQELRTALDKIGFKGDLPKEGVVFILYAQAGKRFLVQVARKDKVSPDSLPGYEWVASDKYLVKYIPEDYRPHKPVLQASATASPAPVAEKKEEPKAIISEPIAEVTAPQARSFSIKAILDSLTGKMFSINPFSAALVVAMLASIFSGVKDIVIAHPFIATLLLALVPFFGIEYLINKCLPKSHSEDILANMGLIQLLSMFYSLVAAVVLVLPINMIFDNRNEANTCAAVICGCIWFAPSIIYGACALVNGIWYVNFPLSWLLHRGGHKYPSLEAAKNAEKSLQGPIEEARLKGMIIKTEIIHIAGGMVPIPGYVQYDGYDGEEPAMRSVPEKWKLVVKKETKPKNTKLLSIDPFSATLGVAMLASIFSAMKDLVVAYPVAAGFAAFCAVIAAPLLVLRFCYPANWYMWHLKHGVYPIRYKKALAKIGASMVPKLIAALDSKDPYVRFYAVRALGEIGDERALEPLKKALVDKYALVSTEARRAIDSIRSGNFSNRSVVTPKPPKEESLRNIAEGTIDTGAIIREITRQKEMSPQILFTLVRSQVPQSMTNLQKALEELKPLSGQKEVNVDTITAAIAQAKAKHGLSDAEAKILWLALTGPGQGVGEKPTVTGMETCKENTQRVKDAISEMVMDFKIDYPAVAHNFAFALVGKSARGEIFYKSDVDYVIVHDDKMPEAHIAILKERMVQALEKSGLAQMAPFATGNIKFMVDCGMTSLMERMTLKNISYVAGEEYICESLRDIRHRFAAPSQDDLDDTILNLLFTGEARRSLPGFNSAEPDVRKGRGGVRDLQDFIRIAQLRYGIMRASLAKFAEEMANNGAITREQAKDLENAENFIFTVMNTMHKIMERESDVLTIKLQAEVARELGFDNAGSLISEYRKHARVVSAVMQSLKRRLRREIYRRKGKAWVKQFERAQRTGLGRSKYERLLARGDDSVRLAIAWHCPYGDILEKVLDQCHEENNRNWNTMFALAHSPRSTARILEKLLSLKDRNNAYQMIPREVAHSRNVPEHFFVKYQATEKVPVNMKPELAGEIMTPAINPFNITQRDVKNWGLTQRKVAADNIKKALRLIDASYLLEDQKKQLKAIMENLNELTQADFENSLGALEIVLRIGFGERLGYPDIKRLIVAAILQDFGHRAVKKDRAMVSIGAIKKMIASYKAKKHGSISWGGMPAAEAEIRKTIKDFMDASTDKCLNLEVLLLLRDLGNRMPGVFNKQEINIDIGWLIVLCNYPDTARIDEMNPFEPYIKDSAEKFLIGKEKRTALILREANHLWTLSRDGLIKDMMDSMIKGERPLSVRDQFKENLDVFKDERASYDAAGADYGPFKGDTFLRTDTGHAIYQEYCRAWQEILATREDLWPVIKELPVLQALKDKPNKAAGNELAHVEMVMRGVRALYKGDNDYLLSKTTNGATLEVAKVAQFRGVMDSLRKQVERVVGNDEERKMILDIMPMVHDIGKIGGLQDHWTRGANMIEADVFQKLAEKGHALPERVQTTLRLLVKHHFCLGEIYMAANLADRKEADLRQAASFIDNILADTGQEKQDLGFFMTLLIANTLGDVAQGFLPAEIITKQFSEMMKYKDRGYLLSVRKAIEAKLANLGKTNFPAIKIGPQKTLQEGIGVVPVEISGNAAGEAFVMDPDKIKIENAVYDDTVKRDFIDNPITAEKDADGMGKTMRELIETAPKDDNILLAFNGILGGFWEPSSAVIINGALITKPGGARGVHQDKYAPLNGKFWVLSLDAGNKGLFGVDIKDGRLPEGFSVKSGILGPPIFINGKNNIDSIVFDAVPNEGGNQIIWSRSQRLPLSAIGYNKEGRLVRVALRENAKGEADKMPCMDELGRVLENLGVTDAVLTGASADVQTYNSFDPNSFSAGKARANSYTGKVWPVRGRPLGSYLVIRAKKEPAPAETKNATQLFDIVESTLNNQRARFIQTANEAGIDVDKTMASAEVRKRVEQKAGEEKFKKELDQFEADGAVGSLIVLARRAKRENQKLIIGLETDWIPAINEQNSLQKQAITGLMKEIDGIAKSLESMGLDNVEIVRGSSSDLAGKVLERADKTGTNSKNVVVMASQDTIMSKNFESLRTAENKPFLAAIDPEELSAFYQLFREATGDQLRIKLAEMLYIALELAAGKEQPQIPLIDYYDKKGRVVIFIPKVESIDYEKLKDIYKAEATALAAA